MANMFNTSKAGDKKIVNNLYLFIQYQQVVRISSYLDVSCKN